MKFSHKETRSAYHDDEAHAYSLADLDEFTLVGYRSY
jgi:hypothetical protein